jgi:hypothetical protein
VNPEPAFVNSDLVETGGVGFMLNFRKYSKIVATIKSTHVALDTATIIKRFCEPEVFSFEAPVTALVLLFRPDVDSKAFEIDNNVSSFLKEGLNSKTE